MMFYPVKIPDWMQQLLPRLLWRIETAEPSVYLTFDDGPTPGVTEWVLDELDKHLAKATFFCLGKQVDQHPELYRQILERGHQVGNHSYSHLNGWKTSLDIYVEDVKKCAAVVDSKLFRPPYGKITPAQATALIDEGFTIVMWDVMPGDFDVKKSAEAVLTDAIEQTRSGSIVVFHDNQKAFPHLELVLGRYLEEVEKLYSTKPLELPL